MRIKEIRISGFKPIPFKATFQEPSGRGEPAKICWESDAFQLSLAHQGPPFLNAIIGPNSSGKSSVLYALDLFFGSKNKLPENWYHRKSTEDPMIVEVTFTGAISGPKEWCKKNCVPDDDGGCTLTLAHVWQWGATRGVYIRHGNGQYFKAGTNDKKQYAHLLPNYRILPADSKLGDDANLDKSNLLSDLIQFILEGEALERRQSIIYKLRRELEKLKELVDRKNTPNSSAWHEIEEIERRLSAGLGSITPGNPNVRLQISDAIPELRQIFSKGKIYIDDGIELDFAEHGMGLQRSFAASALYAWSELIASRNSQDYVFAIEEPELYLHPHATRVFLNSLEMIAEQNQVIFTTHSSEFVNRVPFENVISIRRTANERRIITPDLSSLTDKEKTQVRRYLQEHRSDMLFARAVLLVEGASERYAIPAFAQTLGADFDLDKAGVSVVFVNGKRNFKVYHQILDTFDIPHVILGDGDGNAIAVKSQYQEWDVAGIYILDFDFEYDVVQAIDDPNRCLEIYNECRSRLGKEPQTLADLQIDVTAAGLKGSWWEALKKRLNADINSTYRDEYNDEKRELQKLLQKIADEVIQKNHLLPNAETKRWAVLFKKQGKPLVGRVFGELLTEKEIRKLSVVVEALQSVIGLAR